MRLSVSVCMASYNGEKYIREQLDSILPQLKENDEIIISDDGSADRTREVVNGYIKKDKRIQLVEGPKQGFASNFFNAVKNAENEIIFLCDQDDIWADNKVERVLSEFEKNPKCTTVLHEMYTFENDINEKGELYPIKYRKGFNINVLFSSYWGCCMAFRKDFIDDYMHVKGPFLSHDQLIGLASERNGKTVFIPEKLLYHRVHSDNRTVHKNSLLDQIKFRFQVFSEYREFEETYYDNVDSKCPGFIEKLATDKLASVSEILMLVFIADCCIFGGGRLVAAGFFSFRIVTFILAFMASLPFVIKNFRRLIKNPFVYFTVMFGVCIGIWAIYGYINANPLLFIKNDITRYLSFALLPGFLTIFNRRNKFEKLIDVIVYSSIVLAVIVLILHFILPNLPKADFDRWARWVTVTQLGGFTRLKTGEARIFFRSEIYTQVAIMLCIWKIWHAENKIKEYLLIVFNGVMVFAWLISYTRGFWFGLGVSCLFVLLWQPRIFWDCFKIALKVLGVTCIIIAISSLISGEARIVKEVMDRVYRTLMLDSYGREMGPSDPEFLAMIMRIKTKAMHFEYIRQSPIIGKGLGTQLVGLRNEGVTEYSYFDAIMKFGIVGFLFFLIAYFVFLPRSIVYRIYSPKENVTDKFYSLVTLLIAAYVGVFATSYSNPFIISPLGISLLLVVDVAVYNTRKFEKETEL